MSDSAGLHGSTAMQDPDSTLVEERLAATPKVINKVSKKGFKPPFSVKLKRGAICRDGAGTDLGEELRLRERALDAELRQRATQETLLRRAVKIAESYEQLRQNDSLIEKWRGVCQAAMAYILNSMMLKIGRMGGYKEFKRKEVERMKRQVEYQTNDGVEDQIAELLESDEFLRLPLDEQEEIRERMQERREEAERARERELAKLDAELAATEGEEMTMEELATRLKVDYNMVYPP
ncbi:ADL276Wp [Eremothecium gossypii ATCC 10895]|uniref:ADL276Wp n=1 Tax=Eremothecium gossypii (strain ATCC 10895 / CBS 109.51 / FGSC 9923 / NRRL Y-1056) TaxID=284811 RepID=Q75B53_EREGS|nr:ADL276Wp [Eremothecium gossypii ATCC 10895]AAS51644.1 ADL276Wp [Eremothecium gossypii ATCC 10895]